MSDSTVASSTDQSSYNARQPAPLWRRLAAMLYDTLIVIALLMFATAIALPINKGDAFGSGNLVFQAYLLAVVAGFFLLFWGKGGQTLGMRAWKIQLVNRTQSAPTLPQLLLRLVTSIPSIALLGAGLLWSVLDRDKLAVHDRLSGTQLVLKTS